MIGSETANASASNRSPSPVLTPKSGNWKRQMKNRGKLFLRQVFEFGQHFGFDILPRHFYSEIPDIRQLRQSEQWRAPFDMKGIRGHLDDQIAFVRDCTSAYSASLDGDRILARALEINRSDEGYGEMEAEFLYCFIRRHRPKIIIQIGCGVSTAVCLLASRDEKYQPRIICIEPYPTRFLEESHQSRQIELIRQKAQDVDLEFFEQIGPGDLFFVDSSHTLGPGGEVGRIILSVLPRLAKGAYVHFHDIWFPYDYCPHVLTSDLFFLHETPLLYGFLCMNERYSIAASLSQLFHERKAELQACLPRMIPAEFSQGLMTKPGHHPSSIYLRA